MGYPYYRFIDKLFESFYISEPGTYYNSDLSWMKFISIEPSDFEQIETGVISKVGLYHRHRNLRWRGGLAIPNYPTLRETPDLLKFSGIFIMWHYHPKSLIVPTPMLL